MFTFDITKFVPRFILRDKNGYAVAKAIEAGLRAMNTVVLSGVKCLTDYETMPEWRLDEIAWETGCLYDYKADIDSKRQWIKNAIALYSIFGTPKAAKQFLGGYFGSDAKLEENWQYGGEPFHFRLRFTDTFLPENAAEAAATIENVKNVRSVLDAFLFDVRAKQSTAYAGCAIYGQNDCVMRVAGIDVDTLAWYTDENAEMLLDENGNVLMVEE